MLNDIYVKVTSDTSTVRVIKHNDNSIKYVRLYDCIGKQMKEPLDKERYTCNECKAKETCPFAWDWYNTNGDCLAEK